MPSAKNAPRRENYATNEEYQRAMERWTKSYGGHTNPNGTWIQQAQGVASDANQGQVPHYGSMDADGPLTQDEMINAPAGSDYNEDGSRRLGDTDLANAPAGDRAGQYAPDYSEVPPDETPQKGSGASGGNGQSSGPKPWWQSEDRTRDEGDETSAQGVKNWAGERIPESWMGEIRHFAPRHRAAMEAAYAAGDETAFNTIRDTARNEQYGEASYADRSPGYAYADSDVGPRDLAGLGVDPEWQSEIRGWAEEDQNDWIRALRAGDEESGRVVRDRARKRK